MTPALAFNGVDIRDRGDRLCLTDMWRAAGSPPHRGPANWARKEGASFIAALAVAQNMPEGQVLATTRGRNGTTMGHWQVGMGYAQYLSPDFHMWCNTVVRERMEGRALVPIGSIAEHSERTFGIVRMVAGKVTSIQTDVISLRDVILAAQRDRDEVTLAKFAELVAMLDHPDHASARQVLDEAKVPSKGRGSLNRRTTNGLFAYCAQHGFHVQRERTTNRRMFPREAVAGWLQVKGSAMIARHMDAIVGQGRLQLREPPVPEGFRRVYDVLEPLLPRIMAGEPV